MKKFPKLSHLSDPSTEVFINDDDEIYITEKVDGANFRWTLYDASEPRILAGSRNVEFKQGDKPLSLDETNKQFHHVIQYLEQSVDFETLESIIEEYGDLVFFGEALHTHTVDYDAWDGKHPEIDSDTPNYIGFDVWSVETEDWLPHDEVDKIHTQIGLETVPVLAETTVADITETDLQIPNSIFRTPSENAEHQFNENGLAEGIVIKNDTYKTRAKKVAEYMEEVQQHGTPNDDESLEEMKARKRNAKKFVRTFVTEQRILKNAYKLVDEGEYDELQMPMMKDLPQRVLTDIFTEEGWNILNHEYDIELTEEAKESIRQLASDKCARILKQEMNNPT